MRTSKSDQDPGAPTAVFERHRPALWALAYRMLGSVADADDAVQETFLRWHQGPRAGIRNARAWLIAACTRLCIDLLRSARRRREEYVGPWLPEPLIEGLSLDGVAAGGLVAGGLAMGGTHAGGRLDPAARLERDETLGTAFLLLLERLAPVERAAFLLHEVFDIDHAEIGAMLGKTPVAVRQIVSRARRRLGDARRRSTPITGTARRRLAQAFFAALRDGDLARLAALLAEDARAASDGGGKVVSARRVVTGADRVARFLVGLVRKQREPRYLPVLVNGMPGIVMVSAGRIHGTLSIAFGPRSRRISHVFITRNPDKLRHLPAIRPAGAAPRTAPRADPS